MPRNLDHPEALRRLRAIAALRRKLDADQLEAITEARLEGRTWGQIGVALGVSSSGAYQWFRRRR